MGMTILKARETKHRPCSVQSTATVRSQLPPPPRPSQSVSLRGRFIAGLLHLGLQRGDAESAPGGRHRRVAPLLQAVRLQTLPRLHAPASRRLHGGAATSEPAGSFVFSHLHSVRPCGPREVTAAAVAAAVVGVRRSWDARPRTGASDSGLRIGASESGSRYQSRLRRPLVSDRRPAEQATSAASRDKKTASANDRQ